jgi:hypothetical protein
VTWVDEVEELFRAASHWGRPKHGCAELLVNSANLHGEFPAIECVVDIGAWRSPPQRAAFHDVLLLINSPLKQGAPRSVEAA